MSNDAHNFAAMTRGLIASVSVWNLGYYNQAALNLQYLHRQRKDMMVLRIGMMILSVGVLAILSGPGCEESMNTPQPVVQPSAKVEAGKKTMPFSEWELNRQIRLYMFAFSDYHCRGIGWPEVEYPDDDAMDEYFDRRAAIGLVAGAYIERVGEAAVPAVVGAWEQAESGDGCDERWRLRELLQRLGPAGWKATIGSPKESVTDEHAPASDSDWIRYLQTGSCDELLWELSRDRSALARLEHNVDEGIEGRREWRPGYEPDFAGEDEEMRLLLAIAPTDGGVTDAKLQEWADQGYSVGIRWGAYLALASRGDATAQQRIRDTIRNRFPTRPNEGKWYKSVGVDPFPDYAAFTFVQEVAKRRLKDRWELLLDLLEDTTPKLLAPRAAVLLALDEHWEELHPQIAERARQEITHLHWTEKNEWLQMLMMSVLAGHPEALEDY